MKAQILTKTKISETVSVENRVIDLSEDIFHLSSYYTNDSDPRLFDIKKIEIKDKVKLINEIFSILDFNEELESIHVGSFAKRHDDDMIFDGGSFFSDKGGIGKNITIRVNKK
jgi:hypothetical protein